ncbi:hypothetical protein GY21_18010 [Cryobacterium roopkundense]|uniref:PIN domain-containing protein n=1 Tax=Cryobacterium roopkundense TaxID=1001240 RepID=A0A099J1L0_9MICO|nr:hypothetical protein GY21_18010 [Cryobacterium roopkundense]
MLWARQRQARYRYRHRHRPDDLVIIYAGPSLLVRLLEPGRATSFAGSSQVQLVSTPQALAECAADAVAEGVARGMTPEGALATLADLVDSESGLVQIVEQEAGEAEDRAHALAETEGLGAAHAWHVAAAELCFAQLADAGEKLGFGADDGRQASVARARGWKVF